MKRLFFFTTLMAMLTSSPSFSQPGEDINGGPVNSRTETGVIDGVVLSTHVPTKRLVPYEHVREADMIWSKRVWRTIDLREKINHPLYFPLDDFSNPDPETGETEWIRNSSRWSLWTIIRHHILNGDLTIYRNDNPAMPTMEDGDEFKYPVLPEPGKDYYTDSVFRDEVNSYYLADLGPRPENPLLSYDGFSDSLDANGDPVYPQREIIWVKSEDIIQYRIKEDWYFDKERSVLDVRILGLCPVRYLKDQNTGAINETLEMFWLYFPTDCRYVFNNYFVYNEKNGSRWMSFDDYFWKRRFNSFIHKEENVYDREIDKYKVGVDALMESKKITEDIREIEHDVWSY